jgi:hypothetical protein
MLENYWARAGTQAGKPSISAGWVGGRNAPSTNILNSRPTVGTTFPRICSFACADGQQEGDGWNSPTRVCGGG